MDVRPALDSLGSVFDRCRMLWRTGFSGNFETALLEEPKEEKRLGNNLGGTGVAGVGANVRNASEGSSEVTFKDSSGDLSKASPPVPEIRLIQDIFERVKNECGKCKFDLEKCDAEDSCNTASLNLTVCLGESSRVAIGGVGTWMGHGWALAGICTAIRHAHREIGGVA